MLNKIGHHIKTRTIWETLDWVQQDNVENEMHMESMVVFYKNLSSKMEIPILVSDTFWLTIDHKFI